MFCNSGIELGRIETCVCVVSGGFIEQETSEASKRVITSGLGKQFAVVVEVKR